MDIKLPNLRLYPLVAAPLDAARLEARYQVREHATTVGLSPAKSAWAALRAEVQRGVFLSQDNAVARGVTQVAGQGSRCLPKRITLPDLPHSVACGGPVALVGATCILGATYGVAWLGLTAVGVACEISAALGLAVRYGMAALGALVLAPWGLMRGAYAWASWDHTTRWGADGPPTQAQLQAKYDDCFGSVQQQGWAAVQGQNVGKDFAQDIVRGDWLWLGSPEGQAPEMRELLGEIPIAPAAEGEKTGEKTQEAHKEDVKAAAVRKLLKLCEGDTAWVAHATCVLNNYLGNGPDMVLRKGQTLRHGRRPVWLANQPSQQHTVAWRDARTLVVTGTLGWAKGGSVHEQDAKDARHGLSTGLWYTYRLAVRRPNAADDAVQTRLEAAAWTLGKKPVTVPTADAECLEKPTGHGLSLFPGLWPTPRTRALTALKAEAKAYAEHSEWQNA